MSKAKLELGDVVIARFPEHRPGGHEQEGHRPAIVVGLPSVLGQPRFDLALVVPMTSDRGQAWAAASPKLYPKLAAGVGGLPRDSIVLLEQVRAIDTGRMSRYLGTLNADDYLPIREAFRHMFDLAVNEA